MTKLKFLVTIPKRLASWILEGKENMSQRSVVDDLLEKAKKQELSSTEKEILSREIDRLRTEVDKIIEERKIKCESLNL